MLLPYWRHCLDMLGLVFLGENLDSSLGWSDPLTAAPKRCSLTEGIAVKENLVVYVVPSDGWCRYDQDVVCQSWIYSLYGLFSSPTHSFGLVWLWYFLVCILWHVVVLVVCIFTMQSSSVNPLCLYPLYTSLGANKIIAPGSRCHSFLHMFTCWCTIPMTDQNSQEK